MLVFGGRPLSYTPIIVQFVVSILADLWLLSPNHGVTREIVFPDCGKPKACFQLTSDGRFSLSPSCQGILHLHVPARPISPAASANQTNKRKLSMSSTTKVPPASMELTLPKADLLGELSVSQAVADRKSTVP